MLKTHQQQAGVGKITSSPMILMPRLRNDPSPDPKHGDRERNDKVDLGVKQPTT